jgi:tetratricopeptide (TPR) repeat protein
MAAAVEEAGAAGAPKSPAEEFKEKGNDLFKKNKYEEAILWYSKAVAADPANPVYLANRAQCHIKLENYGTALIDASHAIKVDPSYTKVRVAQARMCTARARSGGLG